MAAAAALSGTLTAAEEKPCIDASERVMDRHSTTALPSIGVHVVRQPAEKQAEISSEILRHGGVRENAGGARVNSGGKRPGAGRKSKRAVLAAIAGQRWYVVEMWAGNEARIMDALEKGEARPGFVPRDPFPVFLPITTVIRRVRGRRTPQRVPMLSGYGFVRFDASAANWAPILQCGGVRRMIRTRSGRPVPVPDDDIARLASMSKIEPGADPLAMKRREPGAHLTVADGPFTSFAAVCIACDGVTTEAWVSIFGRSVRVQLPWSAFEDG